ncbi:MAG TPA: CARDB domain-containing protein [Verrucomicrobiae bacterium]|jgi:hypothetical protein|nr:CARDB domain-containing protein [Verrucomicrobiae bacterium]
MIRGLQSGAARQGPSADDLASRLFAGCVAALVALLPLSARAQSTTNIASREVSVFNFGQNTVTNDAISREVSVFNFGQSTITNDAISREVSVFNFGQSTITNDAISREVSVFNFGQSTITNDAISREVSVFNFGQPHAPIEAISREVSVFKSTNTLADLIPVIVSVPASGTGGTTEPVVFGITNAGKTAAFGPWQNEVLLAPNSNGLGATPLGTFIFPSNLPSGGFLTITQTAILPASAAGQQYFGLFIDSGGYVPEINKSNNTTFATNVTVITAADLALEQMSAPPNAQFGQSISVSFAVTNIGTATAASAWNDQIYLSPSSNSVAGATLLATIAGTSPLSAGAGYVRSQLVALPLTSGSSPGVYYIVTVADAADTQIEISYTNNTLDTPISISLPALPDLAVPEVTAPATALPGSNVMLIWTVTNQGALNITNAGWTESVGVSNSAGISTLATFRFTNSLNAGSFLARTNSVMLPAGTPAGNILFFVTVNSLGDIIESNPTNDTTFAANLTQIPAALALMAPVSSILENTSTPNLSCLLTRNGNLSATATIMLSSSATNHLIVPGTVTIPAGAPSVPFTATVLDDGIVDSNAEVIISAQANGYLSATTEVEVINTDVAQLALALGSPAISEGQMTSATVTSHPPNAHPVLVSIASSSPSALVAPASVTIPAGSNSATFTLNAASSTVLAPPQVYTVTVSAPGFSSASSNLTVINVNTPSLALSLDRTNINEADGPLAVIATISRQPVTDQPLTVALASTNPLAALVPSQVVIGGFQGSANFYVAAVDGTNLPGPRTTLIAAQALDVLSNAVGTAATEVLTVQDTNVPLLTVAISNKVVAKGLDPATTATVARDTPATNALVVTLTSSNPNEATVPGEVTIPSGLSSATFQIASIEDGIPNTSQSVSITAGASNYASGSDVFAVTDLQLPDLVIADVSAPGAVFTGQSVTINFTLANQGLAALTNAVTENIYLTTDPSSGVNLLAGSLTFPGSLEPGQYAAQSSVIPASSLPPPGSYWVLITANVGGAVPESNLANDTGISSAPMYINTEYTAEVQAGVATIPTGTPVPLFGSATLTQGGPAANVQVNLIVIVNNIPRTIGVYTDANGNFSTLFTPLAAEAGSYTVTAVPPGITSGPVQAQFNILGLTANPSSLTLNPVAGINASASVDLQNPSALPLTGLTATISNLAANLTATATLSTNVVDAWGALSLVCTVSAANSSIPQSAFTIQVTSAEGVTLDLPVTVNVIPLSAQLVVSPSQLSTGMLIGSQATVQFYIANAGGAASGPLAIALPNVPWLNVSSPNPMPSLAPGQSNLVTLVLTPSTGLALGPYTGDLAINGTGVGIQVPFTFNAVTDARGSLLIQSVDELTFFAAGSPPLTNAIVTITDPSTASVTASGFTDTNGLFLAAGLMAGAYQLQVTAPQHAAFSGTVVVTPGQTNNIQTFLSLQTVTYTWSVVPTQIQAQAQISIQATFDANVPAPVIVPSPTSLDFSSLTEPGQFMDVPLTLANYGLIAVENVAISINAGSSYQIDVPTTTLGTLAAKSSLTVPMRITFLGAGNNKAPRKSDNGSPCISLGVAWTYPCGGYNIGQSVPIPIFNAAGDCPAGGGGTVVVNGGPGGGGTVIIPPAMAVLSSCSSDPCTDARVSALAGCAVDLLEETIGGLAGCAVGSFNCGYGITKDCFLKPEPPVCGADAGSCLVTFADCFKVGLETINKELAIALDLIKCAYEVCAACEDIPGEDSFCGLGPTPKLASHARKLDDGSGVSTNSDPSELLLDTLFSEAGDVQTAVAPYQYFFGSGAWLGITDTNALQTLFNQFESDVQSNSDGGQFISIAEGNALLALPLPAPLTASNVDLFINRWNNTMSNYAAGILITNQAPPGFDTNFIDFSVWVSLNQAAASTFQTYSAEGSDPGAAWGSTATTLLTQFESGKTGVCAQVVLQIDQTAVLTLNAFHATLQLNNNGSDSLSNVSTSITVQNQAGQDVTSLFALQSPSLTDSLAPGASVTAQWTLVPTEAAAPQAPTNYVVGGTLSYTLDGTPVTIPLAPTTINVQPDPQLYLNYFLQRDVYGDDPYTPQIEPSIPFPLAVMVQNKGYGAAYNFQITSAQPQIVDNQKGLLIGFNIIGGQVGAQPVTPSLTVDFGDILPMQSAVGIWYLTCTLDGQFIDYSATFQNLTSIGNTQLSVINGVQIHSMTHLVQADGAWNDGLPDFLCNDIPNPGNLPDTLYLNNGGIQPVSVIQSATPGGSVNSNNLQVPLTANFPAGFTYVTIPDPANGQFPLEAIRYANGTNFLTNNFWITDRTFQSIGLPPVLQTNLQLFVYHTNAGPDTFTLVYGNPTNAPVTNPPASSVFGLPAQSPPLFGVIWSGAPYVGGAPIAYFDIYVSDNGGPFTNWQSQTIATSAIFNGANGHTYAFYSIATDTAGHRETPPLQPQAQTTVIVNTNPPTITVASNVTINAGQNLSLNVTASDPNPFNTLTFSLGLGAPAGAVVNPATGQITWATSPSFGGTTNPITVIATDNGQPPLSASATVIVVLLQIATPPVLAPIPNYANYEATLLVVTNSAADNNAPPRPLTFSLGPGAPANATIDPVTGIFEWLPTASQAPSTNIITVIVTDNGTPPLSATQQFTVVVESAAYEFLLTFGKTNVFVGGTNTIPVTLTSQLPLTNITAVLLASTNSLTNLALIPVSPEIVATLLQPLGASQYGISFTLNPTLSPGATRTLAQLAFATVPRVHSAIVPLVASQPSGLESSGLSAAKPAAANGQVIVIALEPVLQALMGTNSTPALEIYGNLGSNYRVAFSTNLPSTNWQSVGTIVITNQSQVLNVNTNLGAPRIYYRTQ